MIFEQLGLSVRITNSDGEALPEYQVQETGDDTIQCWIPSTPGVNFQIHWEVTRNQYPKLSIRTLPFLDGVRMRGQVTYRKGLPGTGKLYKHQTGTSKARLYEFGTRDLTDKEDGVQPDQSVLNSLNTIKSVFEWGRRIESTGPSRFKAPLEIGLIHEKVVKKSHSGAAKLGQTIDVTGSTSVSFTPSTRIKPVTFIFCYAPEGWLRARDIIPSNPKSQSEDTQSTLKRERSVTPTIIDVDDLETEDDEIQIVKHMVPVTVTTNKRRRTSGQDATLRTKKEED